MNIVAIPLALHETNTYMNYPEIAAILDEVYELINDDTKIDDTIYESVAELEEDLLNYIDEMKDNSGQWLELLDMHFKKGSTIQLLNDLNNWQQYDAWKQRYMDAKK